MNGIKIPIGKRPNYFHRQLLLEDDFLAEQKYHVDAHRNHNLIVHDWGVIRGLTVTRAHDRTVRIGPGAAIDESGRDIVIEDPNLIVELNAFRPHDRVCICLAYEEADGAGQTKRVDCYAAVTVAKESEPHDRLILATIGLDDQGKVNEESIDYSQTKYARLAAGSITAEQLHDELRKGWLRLAFRPIPMTEGPEPGFEAGLPAFRLGATIALSPDPKEAGEKDRGAAGTMTIPVPPSVTRVTRLRIAGPENKGEIVFKLIRGGWDQKNMKYVRDDLIEEKITGEPFMKVCEVKEEKNTVLDPECHTLTLWLKGTRRTAISLVAVEFVY